MIELKFKRIASGINRKDCTFTILEGPIKLCNIKGKDYIRLGPSKGYEKNKKILQCLFGNELVITRQSLLVPRDFFFI